MNSIDRFILNWKIRRLIDISADEIINKMTKRRIKRALRDSIKDKSFMIGDVINFAFTINVSHELKDKHKRRTKCRQNQAS